MNLKKTLLGGLLAALWMPSVWAASDADLTQIRDEINQLRQTYEARISALEKRLAQAESHATQAEARASDAQEKAGQAVAQATPQSTQNAFNPAVALILSGTYANLSRDPNHYQINGFIPSGSDVSPPSRSFSLAESELALSANIDPYLRGEFMLSAAPDNTVSVENAFIQTLALPHGMTLRAGRFYSGIGYVNEQHGHVWDFVDMPLAQKAFLGGQYANDGVQMRWLAPTDTYLELGAEVGRGSNFPGSNRNKNGAGDWSLFAHAGGDLNESHSWLAGLSYLHTRPSNREFTSDNDIKNSFNGNSGLWVGNLVWKWAPNGNPYQRNFKLQTEYYRRTEKGTLTYDTSSTNAPYAYDAAQSGWYAQGVYQFMPRWRVGARYDRLNYGSVNTNSALLTSLPVLGDYNPTRSTLMMDYNPSEFSRFRLQFARDNSHKDLPDNQVMLQYIMSLGAHGAHQY